MSTTRPVNQQPIADVNCPRCRHVVHYAACDVPLTWYQRLRHRRTHCGCTWWGADYAHKRVRKKGVSRET